MVVVCVGVGLGGGGVGGGGGEGGEGGVWGRFGGGGGGGPTPPLRTRHHTKKNYHIIPYITPCEESRL